jgi:hypothetical protein
MQKNIYTKIMTNIFNGIRKCGLKFFNQEILYGSKTLSVNLKFNLNVLLSGNGMSQ